MTSIDVRFIRHASAGHMLRAELIAGRSLEAELTDEGKTQAQDKGADLARRRIAIDRMFASPAVRCVSSADLILSAIGIKLPIEVDDALHEMDQGNFVGKVRTEVYNDEVQAQIRKRGKDFALPGGESMNQVGSRGLGWLESLLELPDGSASILAISHGGLITNTVGAILGWDQPETVARQKSMQPMAETHVVHDNTGWQVEAFAIPMGAYR